MSYGKIINTEFYILTSIMLKSTKPRESFEMLTKADSLEETLSEEEEEETWTQQPHRSGILRRDVIRKLRIGGIVFGVLLLVLVIIIAIVGG